jgi:hypothetical protein
VSPVQENRQKGRASEAVSKSLRWQEDGIWEDQRRSIGSNQKNGRTAERQDERQEEGGNVREKSRKRNQGQGMANLMNWDGDESGVSLAIKSQSQALPDEPRQKNNQRSNPKRF